MLVKQDALAEIFGRLAIAYRTKVENLQSC